MIHIVSDSSCDLPKEWLHRHHVHLVPLIVDIDGISYRENVDITPQRFYEKMAVAKALPKTSQPTPAAFVEAFKPLAKSGAILCITISSGLSGTYQSACLAREMTDGQVTVFDSRTGSLGHGLQVVMAATLAKAGHSLEEIITELEKYRNEMDTLVLLNTLDNIVKGGRLSKFGGSLGKLLDMRVLLHNNEEGKVVLKDKVRGKKAFMRKVLEEIDERLADRTIQSVGITHFNNAEDCEWLKRYFIEKHHVKEVFQNDMGVTMATYAGTGGLIIAF